VRVVVVALVGGVLLGIGIAFAAAVLLERAGRTERSVAASLLRNPRIAYRMWFDPRYKAVIRDMRKMFGS
jgi:hypothetical protein